jgi:hypothetical protein
MSRPRTFVALAVLLALAATGCGGSGPTSPDEALVDALKRTFENSFSFDISVDADEAVQRALAEEDPQLAALVRSGRLTGRTTGDDTTFTAHALGLDVAEIVSMSDENFYLRIDPGIIALASDGDSSVDDLLGDLGESPAELREPLEALLAGEWLGVDGAAAKRLAEDTLPGGMAFGAMDPGEMRTAFRAHFGSIQQFVREDLEVTEVESGVYDVSLRARDAAGKFTSFVEDVFGEWMGLAGVPLGEESDHADVPETVSGMRVTITDRMIDRVELDVMELARTAGGDDVPDGALRIIADISDHGRVPAVETPTGVRMLDLERLKDAFLGPMGAAGEFGGAIETPGEAPGEASGYRDDGPGSEAFGPQAAAGLLSSAQGGLAKEGGGYTSDVEELLAADPALAAFAEQGVLLGTCTYDAGEQFVVAASDGGVTMYFDSAATGMTIEPVGLGCEPAVD